MTTLLSVFIRVIRGKIKIEIIRIHLRLPFVALSRFDKLKALSKSRGLSNGRSRVYLRLKKAWGKIIRG
jgi:hypothetical protein